MLAPIFRPVVSAAALSALFASPMTAQAQMAAPAPYAAASQQNAAQAPNAVPAPNAAAPAPNAAASANPSATPSNAPQAEPAPQGPAPATPTYPQQPYPGGYPQAAPGTAQAYPGYPAPPPGQPYSQQQAYGGYGGIVPGYHTHDGLFLRIQGGFGATAWSSPVQSRPDKVNGGFFGFNLALGGAVTQNVVLYAEFTKGWVLSPRLQREGNGVPTEGVSLSSSGIGPGMAIYLGNNVFVSGGVQFFLLDVDDGVTVNTSITDGGVGGNLSLGKEWWVSDDWGVGLALVGFMGRAKDNEVPDLTWRASSLMLAMSATYN